MHFMRQTAGHMELKKAGSRDTKQITQLIKMVQNRGETEDVHVNKKPYT